MSGLFTAIAGILPTAGGAGPTLLYDTITGTTSAGVQVCGFNSANYYFTGPIISDTATRNISKVTVQIDAVGTINTKTWTARIWSVLAGNLLTQLGISNGVTGDNSWSASNVDFSFASPVSTASSTYAITLDPNSETGDSANRIGIHYANTTGVEPPEYPSADGMVFWAQTQGETQSLGSGARVMMQIWTP